jgi:hypothetical protein
MSFFNKHNLKAAAIHLAISACIACLALVVVFGLWYPAPLDTALGVSSIFLLMLAIDLVLGPLMTLVVYKPNKASLKFDLTVIACVQLAALAYGLHTVASGRPAYMVFTKDRFDLVLAYEVADITGTPEKPSLAMQSPWAQPRLGYELKSATVPTGTTQIPVLEVLMASALSGGPDIPNVVALQSEYSSALPKIKATAKTFAALKTTDPIARARVSALQAKYPANSIVAPLKIKYTIYTVVMSPVDAHILGIVAVDVF